MPQYSIISPGETLDLLDASDDFRYVNVAGVLHLRQAITSTGFSGEEGVDWDDIEEYADKGGGVWRVGARDLHWAMDCTVTGIGFSGDEDTDWENYEKHKLA